MNLTTSLSGIFIFAIFAFLSIINLSQANFPRNCLFLRSESSTLAGSSLSWVVRLLNSSHLSPITAPHVKHLTGNGLHTLGELNVLVERFL